MPSDILPLGTLKVVLDILISRDSRRENILYMEFCCAHSERFSGLFQDFRSPQDARPEFAFQACRPPALRCSYSRAAMERKENPIVQKMISDVTIWMGVAASGGALAGAIIFDIMRKQKSELENMVSAMDDMLNVALLKQDMELLKGEATAAMRMFYYDLPDREDGREETLTYIHRKLTEAASKMESRLRGQHSADFNDHEIAMQVATLFLDWRHTALFHLLALQAGHDEFPKAFSESMVVDYLRTYSRFHQEFMQVYLDARKGMLKGSWKNPRDYPLVDDFYTERKNRLVRDATGVPFREEKQVEHDPCNAESIYTHTQWYDSGGRKIGESTGGSCACDADAILLDYIKLDVEAFGLLALRADFSA